MSQGYQFQLNSQTPRDIHRNILLEELYLRAIIVTALDNYPGSIFHFEGYLLMSAILNHDKLAFAVCTCSDNWRISSLVMKR